MNMLFGRKKPGFVQIENPENGVVSADLTEQNLQENNQEAAAKDKNKPDLLEYLTSLPEVEDDFAGIAPEEKTEEEPQEEETEARKLAGYIRSRSAGAYLTKYSDLKAEVENLDALLEEIKADEKCSDITFREGKKDRYYYSTLNMSDNYAMIASYVEDKDLVETIAQMVRFNCKTYPAPTPITYFERHPYYATRPQIERAIDLLMNKEEYSDIQRFTNNKGDDFLFSTLHMSYKYANALAKVEDFND